MKKSLFPLVMAFLLFLFVSPTLAAAGLGEAVERLPEDTQLLIQFSSAKALHQCLPMTETTVFGQPIQDLEEIKTKMGFNPFSLKELEANGFDTGKPMGVAFSDLIVQQKEEPPHFNMVFFLPAKDPKKALETVKSLIGKDGKGAKFTQEGDLWKFESPPAGPNAQPTHGYLMAQSGYLFVGGNPKADAKPFMERINGEKPLAKADIFRQVIDKIDAAQELFIYADVAGLAEKNLETIQQFSQDSPGMTGPNMPGIQYIKDYQGMGVSADLESSDLRLKSVLNLVKDSKLLDMFQEVEASRDVVLGFKEDPALLMGFAVNLARYYRMILESLAPESRQGFEQQLAKFKTDYGIDLEKELVDNLGDNLNLGIYDGMSINMANYNTLLSLEVKDPDKMRALMDKFITKMPPEQQAMINKMPLGGQDVYIMMMGPAQLYLGLKGNDLLATVGKPMYEKALNADPSAGFLSKLKSEQLQSILKKDLSFFYLNIHQTFLAVKNFAFMLQQFSPQSQVIITPEISELVGRFDYLLFSSRLKKNTMLGDSIIKTNFEKPFFHGLQEVVEKARAIEMPPPGAGGAAPSPQGQPPQGQGSQGGQPQN